MIRGAYPGVAALLLALLALLSQPHSARAFSDPLAFNDEVAAGGGGGRFFTGSSADGFGCDVCHRSGRQIELHILGLPLAGYEAGAAYEVQIEWPAQLEHFGLALEITDDDGKGAGSVRLPPASELPEPERCEPVEDGLSAGVLTELEGARTILSVPDCGAKRVRFLWTAPAQPQGPLRLTGGLVVSNNMADYGGDVTTMFTRALAPAGDAPALASDIRAQCHAMPGARFRHASLLLAAWLSCGALLLPRMRRRRARARP